MKKLRLNRLFYNNTKSYHKVEYKDHHPQSLASYILLKKYYVNICFKHIKYERRVWLTFRNRLLNRMIKSKGQLDCFYCGRENLTANYNNPFKNFYGGRATLDHFKPLAKGGLKYTESNLVCACDKCNNLKADKTPEDFYHIIKDNPKFKGEFIRVMKQSSLEILRGRTAPEGHEEISA